MTQDAAPQRVRALAAFWWPLAFSWLFMGLESPLLQSFIARSPGMDVQLAAYGLVLGLEILIESPVIMLLATATALGRDRVSCRILFRFQLLLGGLLTVVAAAVAYTPLFPVVVQGALHAPEAVAMAARPALRIMVLWSAAIGWRRYYQGLLIRGGRTRMVGVGTLVRLGCTGTTAWFLWRGGHTSGVETAAGALMAGVFGEAAVATWAARGVVRALPERLDDRVITLGEVLRFHLPLAGTSTLSLLVQPAVLGALGRLPDPVVNEAAWPVVFSLFMVLRCGTFALPETLIAQADRGTPAPVLRRFSLLVAGGTVLATLALILTPVLPLYLTRVLRLAPELVPLATAGAWAGLLLPFAHGMQSHLRGRLMAARLTPVVTAGMFVYLGLVLAGLQVGVSLALPGIQMAMVVVTSALAGECAFLGWRSRTLLRTS